MVLESCTALVFLYNNRFELAFISILIYMCWKRREVIDFFVKIALLYMLLLLKGSFIKKKIFFAFALLSIWINSMLCFGSLYWVRNKDSMKGMVEKEEEGVEPSVWFAIFRFRRLNFSRRKREWLRQCMHCNYHSYHF